MLQQAHQVFINKIRLITMKHQWYSLEAQLVELNTIQPSMMSTKKVDQAARWTKPSDL